jgi:hypothetical protein
VLTFEKVTGVVILDEVPAEENGEEPKDKRESDTFGKVVKYSPKFSLLEKGHNEFEFLPPGWIKLNHNSGMPLYLHQASRVCTWSQPYYIGPGSVRRHEVPISSIPCLKYLRELEREGFKTQPGIVDLTNRRGQKNDPPVVENGDNGASLVCFGDSELGSWI